jgi:hypothetical protein
MTTKNVKLFHLAAKYTNYILYIQFILPLKGQCHEIFDPEFFSSNNPRAKAVSHTYGFVFARIFKIMVCKVRIRWSKSDRRINFRSFNETTGWVSAVSMRTWGSVLVVSMRPQDQFPKSHWDQGIRLEHFCKDSVVSMRLQKQIQQCRWNCGIGFCSLNGPMLKENLETLFI